MLVQACLGLSGDAWNKRIIVDRPTLPIGIDGLAVRRLRVGATEVDVIFQRVGGHVVCHLERDEDHVALVVQQ